MKSKIEQHINWKGEEAKDILNNSMLQISYKRVRN